MGSENAPRVRRVQQSRRNASPKAAQSIIASVRSDIATGRLPLNSRLPNERDLAATFEVSQPTVREALRALETTGLIEIRHGSGAYVVGDTRAVVTRSLATLLQMEGVGIAEAADLRLILGRESARLAAANVNVNQIEAIADACQTIDEAEDECSLWEALLTFQVLLSSAAQNPLIFALETFLVDLIMQFQIRAFASEDTRFWMNWAAKATEDRHQIVAILRRKRRKPDHLVAAVEAYLLTQRSLFMNDERFASVILSDRDSVAALDTPAFVIPDYRQIREALPDS